MLEINYLQKSYRLFLFTAIFFIYYILFLNQATYGLTPDFDYSHYPSDMPFHLKEALDLPLLNFEPLFHLLTHALMKTLQFLFRTPETQNLANSGAIILGLAKLAQFSIINKIIDDNTEWQESFRLFLAVAVMLCSGLILPFININNYIPFGAPNVLHNPTLILLTPLALAFFYIYLKNYIIIENDLDKFKRSIILSILLFLATLTKPAFTNIMLIIILFIYLINPRKFLSKLFFHDLIIYLPSAIFLLIQIYLISKYVPTQGKMIWAPFRVIDHYTSGHGILGFLRVLEFPILIACVYGFRKRVHPRQYLLYSWIFVLISYSIFICFSFTGRYWADANLLWSCNLGLSFLYLFTMIDFANLLKNVNQLHLNEILKNIIIINFSWVLLSGIFYFMRIFLGGRYM